MLEEIHHAIESGMATPDWLEESFPICDVNNVEYGEEYGDEEVPDSVDVDG